MSNYDHDQVNELNNAMIEAWQIMNNNLELLATPAPLPDMNNKEVKECVWTKDDSDNSNYKISGCNKERYSYQYVTGDDCPNCSKPIRVEG